MGYGAYTLSLQESISSNQIDLEYFKLRFFISGLFVYYFETTIKSNSTTNYSFDDTFGWALTGGTDFNFFEHLPFCNSGNRSILALIRIQIKFCNNFDQRGCRQNFLLNGADAPVSHRLHLITRV